MGHDATGGSQKGRRRSIIKAVENRCRFLTHLTPPGTVPYALSFLLPPARTLLLCLIKRGAVIFFKKK
jgi:hypothetical protein